MYLSVWAISSILLFSTSSLAQAPPNNCMPSNCVAACEPSCTGNNICILGMMTNCGQCPASKCVDQSSIVGISPNNGDNNNSNSDNNSNDNDSSNTALIGGLVGGLVAGGLIIGVLVFSLIKYRKNKRITLPITFHSSVQQYRKKDSVLSQQMKESTRESAHSITSGVIPIAYIPPSHHIQEESPYKHHSIPSSTLTSNNNSNNTDNNTNNNNNNTNHSLWISNQQTETIITPPLSAQLSIATPTSTLVNGNSSSLSSPHHPYTSKTALENPFQDPRNTIYSLNSEDDDYDDMDSKHGSVVMVNKAQLASHQAVQVTRAKPQILRVNTVRVNDLSRGNSVRTILTKSSDDENNLSRSNTVQSKTMVKEEQDHNPLSSSSLHHSNDPFQDDRYTVIEEDEEEGRSSSSRNTRPVTNHSMASTIGDGEITIFWSGSNPSHS
ncbi:hypothetical protein BJ944DRAFT_267025 [Cunninghamella echinulata]|nr:hypothetical protein BJ944DRAFT_267025 [Cunninghamella echinulata]